MAAVAPRKSPRTPPSLTMDEKPSSMPEYECCSVEGEAEDGGGKAAEEGLVGGGVLRENKHREPNRDGCNRTGRQGHERNSPGTQL
jgi:hypothetical protein